MAKESILVRRKGKNKTSVFMCRKGKHEWTEAGSYEEKGTTFYLRWCTTCGCLEENSSDDEVTKIKVPDTGI